MSGRNNTVFKFEFLTAKIKEILHVRIPVVERVKADNQNVIVVIFSLKISYINSVQNMNFNTGARFSSRFWLLLKF